MKHMFRASHTWEFGSTFGIGDARSSNAARSHPKNNVHCIPHFTSPYHQNTTFHSIGWCRRGRILLLRRGPQLRTCAGAWGFVGEHAHPGENPANLIERAIREEVRGDALPTILRT